MYGSEIWGIYDVPEIVKLHYKFCKNIHVYWVLSYQLLIMLP